MFNLGERPARHLQYPALWDILHLGTSIPPRLLNWSCSSSTRRKPILGILYQMRTVYAPTTRRGSQTYHRHNARAARHGMQARRIGRRLRSVSRVAASIICRVCAFTPVLPHPASSPSFQRCMTSIQRCTTCVSSDQSIVSQVLDFPATFTMTDMNQVRQCWSTVTD